MKRRVPSVPFLMVIATMGLGACGDQGREQSAKKGPPATLISVAQVVVRPLEMSESSIGAVENVFDPVIAAEVAGRITRVLTETGKPVRQGELLAEIDSVDLNIQRRADAAEVARLEALLANQERVVQRQQKLVAEHYISENALDDAIAQRNALREQLAGARAQLDANRNALSKARVLSPLDGAVEERSVSPGAYVKVGDPLFRLVGKERMQAHLPFPESAAPRLRVGQRVQLFSPLAPNAVIETKIDEIRPSISATSRALNVIVRFQNDGNFRGGGTVNGKVITGRKEQAVLAPEESVVLRPAGKVVYLIRDDKAEQRAVETGLKSDGMIEILSGLSGGETIARDGAGFLTQNAKVTVQRDAEPTPTANDGKAAGPKAGAS
ncbi:MAG TPA: efflux RND transporter periplasmic adaptor subunit [Burkholderiales bacterium]|nr:efflux RND transporter periplasmic adaptor subunit [Burkholderiales bacterium]